MMLLQCSIAPQTLSRSVAVAGPAMERKQSVDFTGAEKPP